VTKPRNLFKSTIIFLEKSAGDVDSLFVLGKAQKSTSHGCMTGRISTPYSLKELSEQDVRRIAKETGVIE